MRRMLREIGGASELPALFEIVRGKAFCLGENDRKWTANLDWLLRPRTAERLLMDPGYCSSGAITTKAQKNASTWDELDGRIGADLFAYAGAAP
jgi:hypothetical protein